MLGIHMYYTSIIKIKSELYVQYYVMLNSINYELSFFGLKKIKMFQYLSAIPKIKNIPI